MAADTLKFQTNTPEIVALEFADGLPVTSRFSGDQVMFTLIDGRRMYVAPFVAEKIKAAGIGAKQSFEICKREIAQGNRRMVEFQVRNLATTGHTDDRRPAPAALASIASVAAHVIANGELAPVLAASIGRVNGAKNGGNSNDHASPTIEGNVLAALRFSGIAAIDAVLEIEHYAQSKGMTDFNFGADNIHKLWSCAFIELSRQGGRR